MESIASILPQLSIGAISVVALGAVVYLFIRHIDGCNKASARERSEFLALLERKEKHAAEARAEHDRKIEEHHHAMSGLEAEMRGNVLTQIKETTAQLKENTHLMTRVIDFFEQPDMTSRPSRRPRRRTPTS